MSLTAADSDVDYSELTEQLDGAEQTEITMAILERKRGAATNHHETKKPKLEESGEGLEKEDCDLEVGVEEDGKPKEIKDSVLKPKAKPKKATRRKLKSAKVVEEEVASAQQADFETAGTQQTDARPGAQQADQLAAHDSDPEDEGSDDEDRRLEKKPKPQPKFFIDDILDDLDFVLTETGLTEVVMDKLRDLKTKCDQMTWIRRRTLAFKKRDLSSYVHIYSGEVGSNYLLGFYNNSYKNPKDLKVTIHSEATSADVETEKVVVVLKPLLGFCVGSKSDNLARNAIKDIKWFSNFNLLFTYKNTPKKYMYLRKDQLKRYKERVLEHCLEKKYDVINNDCTV